MIKLKSLLLEKTLYHGTIIDNIPSIEKYGLLPSIGEFVKNAYDVSGYGDEINEDDYLKELVFATDKKQLNKAVTAITAQIAYKLKKDFHDVTDDEFIRYGALVIIKDGDSALKHRKNDDENYYGNIPYTVEPGDYYSEDYVSVDYILTRNKMILILKRYGLWPRNYIFNDKENINYKKDYLVKLAIKRNPSKNKSDIVKIINSWDDKTINDYYRQHQIT